MDSDGQPSLRRTHFSHFEPAFRWGTSTASYQIEGATHEGGRGESIWDRFCATPGRIRDGSSAETACDHYHRWREDLDLARDLGTNAYRFSIAWPRIIPGGVGAVNAKGLEFYSRLVDGMLERGLEPWPTLYHWDLPQTLQEKGGWASRATVDAFTEYVDVVTRCLGDRVKRWITHNEPWCTAFNGHAEGAHAPGIADFATALQVAHHVLVSHGQCIPVIRRNVRGAKVGAAISLHPIQPASASDPDVAAARRHDGLRNRWFLDPLFGRGYPQETWSQLERFVPELRAGDEQVIAERTDFLGVNYYFPETVADAPGEGPLATRVVHADGVERTAFGWEVSPEGLVTLLERVWRDYRPAEIYLTENGSTYDDEVTPSGRIEDNARRRYLVRHLAAARQAMRSGIPLKGYFAWSLLDNFEWAEGYTRRFGLVHVDFKTQQRRIKQSGEWYRSFLKEEW